MITEDGDLDSAPMTPQPEIAGFWRRIAALALDSLVLGGVGLCIGLFWFDALAALGSGGRLIGGVIAFLYFAILNSDLGSGQTLGKRLLSIRVVSRHGDPAGLPRSSLRAFVLLVPVTLNGFQFPADEDSYFAAILLSTCILGTGGALVYLYVFNRSTRQSLHDLLAATFVVRTGLAGPITGEVWRGHLAIAAAWILAVAIGVVPLMRTLGSTETIASLREKQAALGSVLPTADVSLHSGVSYSTSTTRGRTSVRYLQARIHPRNRPASYEALAERFATALLAHPENWDVDQISIVVTFGYDIMISSMSTTEKFSHSPEEWAERLQSKPAV